MTPAKNTAEAVAYAMTVLDVYVQLPGAPARLTPQDQRQAQLWFQRGVPCSLVETALLLGCLRRLIRPPGAPRLSAIRSLSYFQPVVEELLDTPVPDNYRAYLRHRIEQYRRAHPDPDSDPP